MDSVTLNEDWNVLLSMFPPNWRQLATDTGAIVRKLRTFPDEESILRTLFLHLANGYSPEFQSIFIAYILMFFSFLCISLKVNKI